MNEPMLIVDDEPSYLQYMQKAAVESGFQVSTAKTVAEARELIARLTPESLLVIDGHLPDGSGSDLAAEFCNRFRTLIVSANTEQAQRPGAEIFSKSRGRDQFLAKLKALSEKPLLNQVS